MEGSKNVIVYIDNLLIHSKTHEEHLDILNEVLADSNININLAKCQFGNTEVLFLGFRLTPNGITPGKDKLRVVEKAKIPEKRKK